MCSSGDRELRRCVVQEIWNSGDGEFTRWEFRRWAVEQMGSSGDGECMTGEFSRWRVHKMELMRWGVEEMKS